jgi:hypothetical protein
MDRAMFELVLGQAATGADPSDPLATGGTDASATDGKPAEEAGVRAFGRSRAAAWLDRSELQGDWRRPLVVADADIEDDFGDFCGRRVA